MRTQVGQLGKLSVGKHYFKCRSLTSGSKSNQKAGIALQYPDDAPRKSCLRHGVGILGLHAPNPWQEPTAPAPVDQR